ncbi:hypothetical protein BH23VER1_BH23VER1_16040 [soil metagenome]
MTYDGYLEDGLPPKYGEGAAEAVADVLHGPKTIARLARDHVGSGDIERAVVEWLSLLRHIAHAPGGGTPRWQELQEGARQLLARHQCLAPSSALPPVPAAQLANAPRHKIYLNQF